MSAEFGSITEVCLKRPKTITDVCIFLFETEEARTPWGGSGNGLGARRVIESALVRGGRRGRGPTAVAVVVIAVVVSGEGQKVVTLQTRESQSLRPRHA